MSAVVKTKTPFLNREILIQSLEELSIGFNMDNNKIVIPHLHKYRPTFFKENKDGAFTLIKDSHTNTKAFLKKVEKKYNELLAEHLKRLAELKREADILKKKKEQQQLILEEQEALETKILEEQELEKRLRKIETEKKEYVAKKEKEILEKAEKLGYDVEIIRKQKKTQYILVHKK